MVGQKYTAKKMQELRIYREKNRLCKYCGEPLPFGHIYKNCDSCLDYRRKYITYKGARQRKSRNTITWKIKNNELYKFLSSMNMPLHDALLCYANGINVSYRTAQRYLYENKPASSANRIMSIAKYGIDPNIRNIKN